MFLLVLVVFVYDLFTMHPPENKGTYWCKTKSVQQRVLWLSLNCGSAFRFVEILRTTLERLRTIRRHSRRPGSGYNKQKQNTNSKGHSSYSEGDHCPLRLSGLPAAHTFFWVIPQRPAPYFTVHSVGCLQPTPSSERFLKARTLFHLVSEWFLKARTLFHRSLSEMQLVQDSVKKILYTSGFSPKNLAFCAICFIKFACGAIFSSKILRQLISDSQFPCRK